MGAKDSKLALGPLEGQDLGYAKTLHSSWIASGAGFLLTPEDVAALLEISVDSAQASSSGSGRTSAAASPASPLVASR